MKDVNRILVVDDDASVRRMLSVVLGKEGFDVVCADDGIQGIEAFRTSTPDIVLMDIRMPEMNGLQAIEKIRTIRKEATVIFMTAHAAVETAVQALKLGAFDYILKPFDLDEVLLLVRRALQLREMRNEIILLHRELSESYLFERILTGNARMKELCAMVARIAKSNANVLITGESGSGKELIATAIHYNSLRSNGPLVKINCGAIPEGLLESEFFGHEKGAFTGALMQRKGRFEQACGGTIFLDEIGDIPLNLQVKLLRILQEREFERVGGNETIKTDMRVIVATNRNLESMVKNGEFRQDLYYRLNVVNLSMPPLRERPEDIRLLADHFLQKFASENQKDVVGFDESARDAMQRYPWPGNVRELANAVERAVIMGTGTLIFVEDLPDHVWKSESPGVVNDHPAGNVSSLRELLEDFESRVIAQALERNQGNRAKTARELGISRRSLLYKLQEYNLS